MQRLTLTEFIITLALVLGAVWLAGQAYQAWLVNLTTTAINNLPR